MERTMHGLEQYSGHECMEPEAVVNRCSSK